MLIGNARKKAGIAAAVILFGIMGLTAGCGTTAQKSNAVSVKTMKVLQQDVSVSHDYSGEVQSTDAVAIKPRVSGSRSTDRRSSVFVPGTFCKVECG